MVPPPTTCTTGNFRGLIRGETARRKLRVERIDCVSYIPSYVTNQAGFPWYPKILLLDKFMD
jgi:hypothetical protein